MKRLFRSRKNRIIAGVCGGIGEYLDIDPVLIRIVWVVLTIFGGMSILAYIIAWILIPDESDKKSLLDNWQKGKNTSFDESRDVRFIVALFLIFIGLMVLLNNLGFVFWNWTYSWPALLIILGVIIILSRREK